MRNYSLFKRMCVVLGATVSLYAVQPEVGEPNTADLVRAVRQSEMWLSEMDSLLIEATRTWTSTAQGTAKFRKKIEAQFDILDPSETLFPELKKSHEEMLYFAFDTSRFRFFMDKAGYCRHERIWDGHELRFYDKHHHRKQDTYTLTNDHDGVFYDSLVGHFGWPMSQYLTWRWTKPLDTQERRDREDYLGRAEDFIFVGKGDYRGVPCYVLEYRIMHKRLPSGMIRKWYVGQSKPLLHGLKYYSGDTLTSEIWTLDYKEVVSDGWLPQHTGWGFYDSKLLIFREMTSWCDIKVENIEVNKPLLMICLL